MGRLGDLLERESLITGEKERQEMEKLSHNVGLALSELLKTVQPLPALLENLKVGKSVGESHIIEHEGK